MEQWQTKTVSRLCTCKPSPNFTKYFPPLFVEGDDRSVIELSTMEWFGIQNNEKCFIMMGKDWR